MTGAENLMNTVINSLSMIDHGFTVTLTVQPHHWDGDEGDYDEEDDEDDEPHVSDDVIEEIKEFSRRIDECMSESLKSQVFDHHEQLVKEKLSGLGHDDTCGKWPKVGDEVWYKTCHGNYECGKVKVVCHNTIQLDNNITIERRQCFATPFEVGYEVWFVATGGSHCGDAVIHGIITGLEKEHRVCGRDKAKIVVGNGIYTKYVSNLFDSLDDLLGFLRYTAHE